MTKRDIVGIYVIALEEDLMSLDFSAEQAQEAMEQGRKVLFEGGLVVIGKIVPNSVYGPECFVRGERARGPNGRTEQFESWVLIRKLSLP